MISENTAALDGKQDQPAQAVSEKRINTAFLHSLWNETGMIALFGFRFIREVLIPPYEWKELMKQCYNVGNKSLGLIGITGFIMGLVLTIQSRPTLEEFGAASWLPAMVSVSVIREIGPVITALICAGKVGSGMGAELASMKVTEQIDAMEVSAINPFKYLVVTRVLATTLMVPVLVIFADVIALLGSFAGVNIKGDVSFLLFQGQVFDTLTFSDLLPAVVKTFFFGYIIGLVACTKGYHSDKGTEGVGESANASVVIASLLIFIIDMIAVQITDIFFTL